MLAHDKENDAEKHMSGKTVFHCIFFVLFGLASKSIEQCKNKVIKIKAVLIFDEGIAHKRSLLSLSEYSLIHLYQSSVAF